MPNGKLTVGFNEEGSYTAYVTASNSAGGLDSAKISFTVKKYNAPDLQTGAIYTIHPKGVNLYIASSGTKNLSNVCLSNKVNNSSKWKLMYDNNKKAYYFVNISSNRVLDINGSSVKNGGGQNVQIYDKNGCSTEFFDLVKNSDGTYIIRIHTNKNVCIDCKGTISTLKNSSNVWTYVINHDNTQKFVFAKVN
ncbi:RICIN domain-containing protein [Ruminococcus albus]|uniref:Ricin-type beta-trefoil lectin domain-like n=1 Tax=Ruminococcus albus TaxID=1264 RepID=A0A1I1RSC3_RUMAL|nr:RICIN domain-containing protein [Ruminococcus albus]SFD37171.1 Ricin-type beta-trefoil lectin domain-like [Ruminococcus albus]